MRRTAKRKYHLKHEYIKGLVPKELHEISDSAIDHIGDVLSRIDPLEALGFAIGANFAIKMKLPIEQILLNGASGAFAVRGLGSQNEVVGLASVAVLAGYGIGLASGDGLAKYASKQRAILEDFFTDPTISKEERAKRRREYETYGWY